MSEDIVSTSCESTRSECYLYHIHREGDDDISNGYIGISNDPKYRFRKHRENPSPRLRNVFNKYDDVVLSILDEGSREDMLSKEAGLRPTDHVGWNIVPGGGAPPMWSYLSEEARARRSAGVSKAHKGIPKNHGDKIKLTKAGKPVISTCADTGIELWFQSVTHAVSFNDPPMAPRNGYITKCIKHGGSTGGYTWRFASEE